MKHLVTGANGFLGSLIVKELLKSNLEVIGIDTTERTSDYFSDQYKFFNFDVRDPNISKIMQDVEVVHHNAALVPLTKAGSDFFSVNVHGTINIANLSKNFGVSKFIHMSSSAVFGAGRMEPIADATPRSPVESYGQSKAQAEIELERIFAKDLQKLMIIRPRTILGPGRLGIFQILFKRIEFNRNIYTFGNGKYPFQFIHSEDLINAYLLLFNKKQHGYFNIGTDRYGTLIEALKNLISNVNSTSEVNSLNEKFAIATLSALDRLNLSPLGPYHYLTFGKPYHFNIDALHNLNWQCKYSNDEMLLDTFSWYKSNKGTENSSPHRKNVSEGILKFFRL